jgi:hypothetical protein
MYSFIRYGISLVFTLNIVTKKGIDVQKLYCNDFFVCLFKVVFKDSKSIGNLPVNLMSLFASNLNDFKTLSGQYFSNNRINQLWILYPFEFNHENPPLELQKELLIFIIYSKVIQHKQDRHLK